MPVEYNFKGLDTPIKREQERRTKWRSLFYYIKAIFDAVDKGLVTIEQAFLADTVLVLTVPLPAWFPPLANAAAITSVISTLLEPRAATWSLASGSPETLPLLEGLTRATNAIENLVYPFRYSHTGSWQQIGFTGTGHLSSYGVGSINDARDITAIVQSTGQIAAGPNGQVVVTWTRFNSGPHGAGYLASPIVGAYSGDHGKTWNRQGFPISDPAHPFDQGSQVAFGKNNEVYVAYEASDPATDYATDIMVLARSKNGGLSWETKDLARVYATGFSNGAYFCPDSATYLAPAKRSPSARL